jgi:uncharacterized protein YbjT (DUF2867 family)
MSATLLPRRQLLVGTLMAAVMASSACASTPSANSNASGSGAVVLVAGATGGTGKEVVKQAVAKGYKVRVLVRDEAKARTEFGNSVTYVVGNVREPATLPAAVKGAAYVVSALGSNSQRDPQNKPEFVDYGGVKSLVEASKAAGVKQFVLVSSMGVTDKENALNKMFDRILEWKLKGEDFLRASGVPYTVVRPGGLRDEPGGAKGVKSYQGDPKIRGQIPRADVARVCIEALGTKGAQGKTFEILSDDAATSVDWTAFWAGIKADGA